MANTTKKSIYQKFYDFVPSYELTIDDIVREWTDEINRLSYSTRLHFSYAIADKLDEYAVMRFGDVSIIKNDEGSWEIETCKEDDRMFFSKTKQFHFKYIQDEWKRSNVGYVYSYRRIMFNADVLKTTDVAAYEELSDLNEWKIPNNKFVNTFKYPGLVVLKNNGFYHIGNDTLNLPSERIMSSDVNFQGKTVEEVLNVDTHFVEEFHSLLGSWNSLRTCLNLYKQGYDISKKDAFLISELASCNNPTTLIDMFESFEEFSDYVHNQADVYDMNVIDVLNLLSGICENLQIIGVDNLKLAKKKYFADNILATSAIYKKAVNNKHEEDSKFSSEVISRMSYLEAENDLFEIFIPTSTVEYYNLTGCYLGSYDEKAINGECKNTLDVAFVRLKLNKNVIIARIFCDSADEIRILLAGNKIHFYPEEFQEFIKEYADKLGKKFVIN